MTSGSDFIRIGFESILQLFIASVGHSSHENDAVRHSGLPSHPPGISLCLIDPNDPVTARRTRLAALRLLSARAPPPGHQNFAKFAKIEVKKYYSIFRLYVVNINLPWTK